MATSYSQAGVTGAGALQSDSFPPYVKNDGINNRIDCLSGLDNVPIYCIRTRAGRVSGPACATGTRPERTLSRRPMTGRLTDGGTGLPVASALCVL
jgi:hypothetical protein